MTQKQITLPPRSLASISDSVAQREGDFAAGDTIVVTPGCWDSATKDERVVFINMMRIHGINYRTDGLSGTLVLRP